MNGKDGSGTDRSHTRWPGWKPPLHQGWAATPLPHVAPVNRLLNPCPACGAKRYERCFQTRVLMDPAENGKTTIGTYPVVKDDPCSRRPIKVLEPEEG